MKKVLLIMSFCLVLMTQWMNAQDKSDKPAPAPDQTGASKSDTEKKESWAEKIKLTGDLRYRHEMIDEQDKDSRTRHRLRARLTVEAKPNDDLKVILRLASGENEDPVSTNQTLGYSFTKKTTWLDQAYFSYMPGSLKGFQFSGGKMKNPFKTPGSTDLLWDGDLNPEGISLGYESKTDIGIFLAAGGFWVEERKADDDTMLYGIQAGLNFKLGDKTKLTIGGGYFTYDNIKDFHGIYDPAKGFGNTMAREIDDDGNETGNLLYVYDYELIETLVEFSTQMGSIPIAVYGDFVQNGDPDEDNTAMLFGLTVGKLKNPWSYEFSYNYREVEKDGVLGAFTDSDFIGGGTNGKGHKLGFGLQLAKNWNAGVTYFMNEKNLDDTSDYNRFQFDLGFKF